MTAFDVNFESHKLNSIAINSNTNKKFFCSSLQIN